jgi:hypothetical protein
MSPKTVIEFNDHWQTPAITEYYSYQKILGLRWDVPGYTYIAFPWATLIDHLQTGQDIPESLVMGFEKIIVACRSARHNTRLLTVCQHIYAQRFSSVFKSCYLDVVYWSHATIGGRFHDGIEWHPFPLYPVQRYSTTRDGPLKPLNQRRYNGSFIGAYEAKYYLSTIREEIFKLSSLQDKYQLLITKREQWHFQEAVYNCQIYGRKPEDAKLKMLEIQAKQYRDVLMESIFSLCPSGSGANSIRLWESLTYGCIPLIFADSLALPGEQQIWIEACVFMAEASNYTAIAENLLLQSKTRPSELRAKQEAAKLLESRYGVDIFIWDLLQLEGRISLATNYKHTNRQVVDTPNKEPLQLEQDLVIVDPGLKSIGSHHHKINSQLANAFVEKQILVLSHQQFKESNLNYQIMPIFGYSVYDDLPDLPSQNYCQQVQELTAQLTQTLRNLHLRPWLYVHTAAAAQIQMIANSIELLDEDQKPLGIDLQLMFEPRSLSSSQDRTLWPRSTSRYKFALQTLHRKCEDYGIRLIVETSNPIFQQTFSSLISQPKVGIHPHLFQHKITSDQALRTPSLPYRLLIHSGDPRSGKGLEWIMGEIRTWIQKTDSDVQFIIHLGTLRFPEAYAELARAIAGIELIAEAHPERLIVKRGYLNDEQWAELALNTHAIALLHDPRMYQFKTSGNLYDYLEITQGNRLILTTAHTNSIENLRFYGIPHLQVFYHDSDSLLAAIQKMRETKAVLPRESQGWTKLANDFFAISNSEHLQAMIHSR